MPPCTWMQSWVQCSTAAGASVAATAAANSKAVSSDGFSLCSSIARAASHTAAVARSVSAIISAHLCLMAWNWPIGLPNCSRILAYAVAVSVAQRATPMHSADSSVDIRARASVRLRLLSTRSSPTSTALARTSANGRSGSTLVTGSISSGSASSTTHSSPLSIATGSTSTDACAAAGTARTSPRMTRPSPCRVAVSPESMA